MDGAKSWPDRVAGHKCTQFWCITDIIGKAGRLLIKNNVCGYMQLFLQFRNKHL
jgi:hypothetical protein